MIWYSIDEAYEEYRYGLGSVAVHSRIWGLRLEMGRDWGLEGPWERGGRTDLVNFTFKAEVDT